MSAHLAEYGSGDLAAAEVGRREREDAREYRYTVRKHAKRVLAEVDKWLNGGTTGRDADKVYEIVDLLRELIEQNGGVAP